MFWEKTNLLIILPMFLTYFCRLSKRRVVQLLPVVLSAGIMLAALLGCLLFPTAADLGRSIAWAGGIALVSSGLALFILQQVEKVHNIFNK